MTMPKRQERRVTDKERIAFMLKIEAIGGEWYDPKMQDWPSSWDSEVMRIVVDAAIKSERAGSKP